MEIELSVNDRANILEAWSTRRDDSIDIATERVYRAGIAAGIERAAKLVERNPVDRTHYEMATAIRALTAPATAQAPAAEPER